MGERHDLAGLYTVWTGLILYIVRLRTRRCTLCYSSSCQQYPKLVSRRNLATPAISIAVTILQPCCFAAAALSQADDEVWPLLMAMMANRCSSVLIAIACSVLCNVGLHTLADMLQLFSNCNKPRYAPSAVLQIIFTLDPSIWASILQMLICQGA